MARSKRRQKRTSAGKTAATADPLDPRSTSPGKLDVQILEVDVRFSECLVWRMIENYYKTKGPSAWEVIPFYPTTNTYLADTYAAAMVALLKDYGDRLEMREPLYIVEMAAGHGVFGYYVMKELRRRLSNFSRLRDLDIRYVLTDFTDGNVSAWESYSEFEPFLSDGTLDFAVFKPEEQDSLELKRAGITIRPGSLKNPLIAIGNYFFDSLRNEFFRFDHGKLQEARVSFYRETASPEPPAFEEIRKVDSFAEVPLAYYSDERLDQVLAYYAEALEQGSVLFPVGALSCVRNLERLSGGELCLFVTDKGFTDLTYMSGHYDSPYEPMHDCTSFMVNFNALARYFEFGGGYAFLSGEHHRLNTGIFISTQRESLEPENTREFSEDALRQKSLSHSLYYAYQVIDEVKVNEADPEMSFTKYVALLKVSNYDPQAFAQCCEQIYTILPNLAWHQREIMKDVAVRVEENLFPRCSGEARCAAWLRMIFSYLEMWQECVNSSVRSIARGGETAHACYYAGLGSEHTGAYRAALEYYQRAAELDSECEYTRAALSRVRGELVRAEISTRE